MKDIVVITFIMLFSIISTLGQNFVAAIADYGTKNDSQLAPAAARLHRVVLEFLLY